MGSYANVHVSISFYLPSRVNGGVSVFCPHSHVNLCVLKCAFIYVYLCVFTSLHVFETVGPIDKNEKIQFYLLPSIQGHLKPARALKGRVAPTRTPTVYSLWVCNTCVCERQNRRGS